MLKFIKPKYFSSKACVECKNYIYETKKCKLFNYDSYVEGVIVYQNALEIRNSKCGVDEPFYFESNLENLKKQYEIEKSNYAGYFYGLCGSSCGVFGFGLVVVAGGGHNFVSLISGCLIATYNLIFYLDKQAKICRPLEQQIKTIEEFNNVKK